MIPMLSVLGKLRAALSPRRVLVGLGCVLVIGAGVWGYLRFDALSDALAGSKTEVARLEADLAETRADLDQARFARDAALMQIAELRRQAEAEQARLQELQARNRLVQAEISDLHTRIAQLDLEVRIHAAPSLAADEYGARHADLVRLLVAASAGSDDSRRDTNGEPTDPAPPGPRPPP